MVYITVYDKTYQILREFMVVASMLEKDIFTRVIKEYTESQEGVSMLSCDEIVEFAEQICNLNEELIKSFDEKGISIRKDILPLTINTVIPLKEKVKLEAEQLLTGLDDEQRKYFAFSGILYLYKKEILQKELNKEMFEEIRKRFKIQYSKNQFNKDWEEMNF